MVSTPHERERDERDDECHGGRGQACSVCPGDRFLVVGQRVDEAFATGGGVLRFQNFDPADNSRMVSVREALQR